MLQEKLRVYGLLKVRDFSDGKRNVYVAELMSLPFVVQNNITVTIDSNGFSVSSGVVFDSKDVSKEVVDKVEAIINNIAERNNLEVWKAADSFIVRKNGENLAKLDEALVKIVEAVRELNQSFSEAESICEECLRKKASQMFYFE
jgi:hypothetical protein